MGYGFGFRVADLEDDGVVSIGEERPLVEREHGLLEP